MKPKVSILTTDGTNCDEELFYAFEKFGADPEYIHINQLRSKVKNLKNFQILAIPGGFTYGDDVVSGKILAVEIISFLQNQINDFVNKNGIIIGICNGFQVLIKTGLLPSGKIGSVESTLSQNNSGRFECRWVKLRTEKSKCVFLNSHSGQIGEYAVNHGEGNFLASKKIVKTLTQNDQILFKYVNEKGKPTQGFPQNPNGSQDAIAGICDLSGRILGLMPHPEKFVTYTQHPNWRRIKYTHGASALQSFSSGGFIFENMINFVSK